MEERMLEELTSYLMDGQNHSIRIYGHGASGKSSFSRKLIDRLGSERANLLETDAYILAEDYRKLLVPRDFPEQKLTASMPAAHELKSLERDILTLQAGLDILTIDLAWAPSRRLSASKPILLVEGVAAAFLPKALFDLSICFYTDGETELQRRLSRDTAVRGRDKDWVRSAHACRRQQYQHYYQVYQPQADILISQAGEDFKIEKMSKDWKFRLLVLLFSGKFQDSFGRIRFQDFYFKKS